MIRGSELWSFETAKFRVTLEIEPSYDQRYDGDDEDGETQRKIDAGVYVMFDSVVRVVHIDTGAELGLDSLCNSVYENPSDFCTGENRNGYFRDMVRSAIADARKSLRALNSIGVRQ